MSSTVFEYDELLADIKTVLNEVIADSKNVRSESTAEMVHETLTRLIAQKEALCKERAQLADLKSSLQGVEVQKETIERLEQKVAVEDAECALAMNRKNFYDKESMKIADLKAKVHQKFEKQRELLENRLNTAEERLSCLSTMSGIRIKSIDGHQQLVIELINPATVETLSTSIPSVDDEFEVGKRPANGLQVTITFSQTPSHCQRIASIVINSDTLSAEELIKEAISTNDIQWFLVKLRQRWLKNNSLSAEIEPLSHRYALDWLCDEGLIRVLYGRDASIVCTLKLNNYPENTVDGVVLQSASGLPAGVTSESLRIPLHSSLKLALEYLDSHLSNRH